VSLAHSMLVDNRAAIRLLSDAAGTLIYIGDPTSGLASPHAADASMVQSTVRLEEVTFSRSGTWRADDAIAGGGDVSAFDVAVVYSDTLRTVQHGCGDRACPPAFQEDTSVPLACSEAAAHAFLSPTAPWIVSAMKV
jgi:hypothetical protein